MAGDKDDKRLDKRRTRTSRRAKTRQEGLLKSYNRRVLAFFLILVLLFLALLFRLVKLQVVEANSLSRMALGQMTRKEEVQADRGLIYDREGKRLVNNSSYSDIYLDMDLVNKLEAKDKAQENDPSYEPTKEKEALLKALPKDLGMDQEEVQALFKREGTIKIGSHVDRSVALDLRDRDLASLSFEDLEGRDYPNDRLASHVLGFTNSENQGAYGLEKHYNQALSGRSGVDTLYADTRNAKMPGTGTSSQAPLQGSHLVLTLSQDLQARVEEALVQVKEESKARRAMAIVQDNRTGEILAMAAKDDYNPNDPRGPQTPVQEKTWGGLSSEDKEEIWYDNWKNPNVSDVYEPGSTFKVITAAAALEESSTDPKKHYYCTGYIRDLPGTPIKCSSLPNPHGDITMAQAFAKSCNTSFVTMARDLGVEALSDYINNFGFGQKTGIDLPGEEVGLAPKSPQEISETRLATLSFGHGIAVTPIQMVTAISAATNGGHLMEPHLVKEVRSASGQTLQAIEPYESRQVVSQATSDKVLAMMEETVISGTGSLAQVPGYRVGGKTGTAEKVADSGGYEKGKYISSFVGVAPIQDPRVTVLVIVEEPEGDYYGGTVAAPVAGQIIGHAMEVLGIAKDPSLEGETAGKVIVPDLVDMILQDAGKTLIDAGLKFSTDTKDLEGLRMVASQDPAPGTEVAQGSLVSLTLAKEGQEDLRMPLLLGKDQEEVIDILEDLGVKYEVQGQGQVIDQEPKMGEVIRRGDQVIIRLGQPLDSNDDDPDTNSTNANSSDNNEEEV